MAEQFFKVRGKLLYEPARQDLKKTFKAKTLIVQFPFDDLANIYRWFIKKTYGISVDPPMWGNHVTVVRGDEKPPHKEHWKKYEGETVELEISPHLYKIWQFWALPVRSQKLHDIRAELGLTAMHELHVTIGREVSNQGPAELHAMLGRVWSKKQLSELSQRPLYGPEKRGSEVVEVNGRKVLKLKEKA